MLKVKTLLFFFHIIKDTLGTYNIMHINYIKLNIMGIMHAMMNYNAF